MSKIALVVPSIREESLNRFVEEWEKTDLFSMVEFYLIEDNPRKTFSPAVVDCHISWEDIERDLGDNSWIIPRRTDCVRSYGYWRAYKDGCDYLLTLDDDCYPEKGFEDLVGKHLEMLEGRSRWFNTLTSVKPRGIPFYNTGKDRKVFVNHGLWTNVLDYDAPTQLAAPLPEEFAYDNRIVPQHSYFPFCGMNWMCRREVIPLMYHLLMGQMPRRTMREYGPDGRGGTQKFDPKLVVEPVVKDGVKQPMLEKLPFDRFGDIHCGIIMKKICDVIGWNVSSGIPYIHHDRASNVFANLKKEANGLEVNETFWQHIDDCLKGDITLDPVWLYKRLGQEIEEKFVIIYKEYDQYYRNLGRAMQIWADLFVETTVEKK